MLLSSNLPQKSEICLNFVRDQMLCGSLKWTLLVFCEGKKENPFTLSRLIDNFEVCLVKHKNIYTKKKIFLQITSI